MQCDALQKIQRQFQAYLQGQHRQILSVVTDNRTCSKEARMQVYQNAYLTRLQEALANDYPILTKLMGSEKLDGYTLDYVLNNPSTYRSIRWFGEGFADFLKTVQDASACFWSELAVFEKTLNTVFDAQDAQLVTESTLQRIAPDQWASMTFEFHASVMIDDFSWNVPTAWKAAQKNRKITPKQYKNLHTYLFWRCELEPCFQKLNAKEAWALRAAQRKLPFAELCEGLSTWVSEDKLIRYVAELLKYWIHMGLIIKLELN